RERVGEPLVVAVEALRELPENRTELRRVDERLDPLVEALESLTEVGQTLDVRQEAARLHREDEVRRSLLDPARDRVPLREAVEGRVDLDRVEDRRVVLEPAARRQPFRVDDLAEVLVVPAGAADAGRLQLRAAASSLHS